MNDESRPLERPTAIAAGNVPRPSVGLRPADSGTPLQHVMKRLCHTLAGADRLDERDRAAFADIGLRMFTRALGPELVIAEAEQITRRAA
jgi:hypothetical protein